MTIELVKKKVCFVAISCTEASDNGEMEVSMDYEGDPCLAAVLLQDALRFFHAKMEEETLLDGPSIKVVK
jgi:hypothetical protein